MKTNLLCVTAACLLALRLPAAENLIENGEMKDGAPPIGFKLEDTPLAAVDVFTGNPLPGDTSLKGASCLKFSFRQASLNWKGYRINQKILLDPSKTYRFTAKVLMEDRLDVMLSGRAHNLEKRGKKAIEIGGREWAYQCSAKGPFVEWKVLECLLPASNSGEKGSMPADLAWVDLMVSISSKEPGVVYLGDLVMEEAK